MYYTDYFLLQNPGSTQRAAFPDDINSFCIINDGSTVLSSGRCRTGESFVFVCGGVGASLRDQWPSLLTERRELCAVRMQLIPSVLATTPAWFRLLHGSVFRMLSP